MRVAIVQSEARTDDAAVALAHVLRAQGHEAVLLVPQHADTVITPSGTRAGRIWTPSFAAQWQAQGFDWIPVGPARGDPEVQHFPRDPAIAVARSLASLLTAFDVAWFFERHWAAPALRERRFRERALPVIVLDEQPDPVPIPDSIAELNRSGAQQYALRWSDLVTAPTANAVTQVAALWTLHTGAPPRVPRKPLTSPAVTVCVPYFEAPEFLPQTLASLDRQTSNDFTVVVVDDGSLTAAGREAFDRCEKLYAARGWRFLRQTNQSPGAARNHAAKEAKTEFLLFLDSDDIAMPTMVERFLYAALLTGDDCLTVPNYTFRDDPEGECVLLYDPPGNSLVASICDDMHGGSCIFIRRETFWQFGGFSAVRGVGFEDYELHIRLNLHRPPPAIGWDVLPEQFYRYRQPQAGNVSRLTKQYSNHEAVLRWYRKRLQPAGLGQLPLALAAAHWRLDAARHKAEHLEHQLAARVAPHKPRGRQLKLLLLTCYFPYGFISGWQIRVDRMIKYFGSRYQLTLATSMAREQLTEFQKEASRYLYAVHAIGGGNLCAGNHEGGDDLPLRIQSHYTDTFRNALRALDTRSFHFALLDQIFMAEFRRDIDTRCAITEHNIESRLLRQAAERQWDRTLPVEFRDPLDQATLLERYEDRAWSEVALRAACSHSDAAQIDRRAPGGYTVVVPNGADPESWIEHARFSCQTVLFPGQLHYLPNVDAIEFLLRDIWPRVLRRKPRARLILAGLNPAPGIIELAARCSRVELRANPASMRRIAQRASIVVAPLRLGSGTRTKIIEALAWGLPVVSTSLGAEGIDVLHGEHILYADTAEAIAENLLQLLTDKPLWKRLRANGRELVRQRYSWDQVFAPLEDALIQFVC
jgi:glycosyltransferase involved in cell wall biosynthesis